MHPGSNGPFGGTVAPPKWSLPSGLSQVVRLSGPFGPSEAEWPRALPPRCPALLALELTVFVLHLHGANKGGGDRISKREGWLLLLRRRRQLLLVLVLVLSLEQRDDAGAHRPA